jgi:anti-sigma regulatory factor (Ser/Thr protein kinase)
LWVSARAQGMVQLVVSELVTNARTYAPGPCLLTLEVHEGAVEVTVWDSEPSLPVARAADAGRAVLQHVRPLPARAVHGAVEVGGGLTRLPGRCRQLPA